MQPIWLVSAGRKFLPAWQRKKAFKSSTQTWQQEYCCCVLVIMMYISVDIYYPKGYRFPLYWEVSMNFICIWNKCSQMHHNEFFALQSSSVRQYYTWRLEVGGWVEPNYWAHYASLGERLPPFMSCETYIKPIYVPNQNPFLKQELKSWTSCNTPQYRHKYLRYQWPTISCMPKNPMIHESM